MESIIIKFHFLLFLIYLPLKERDFKKEHLEKNDLFQTFLLIPSLISKNRKEKEINNLNYLSGCYKFQGFKQFYFFHCIYEGYIKLLVISPILEYLFKVFNILCLLEISLF